MKAMYCPNHMHPYLGCAEEIIYIYTHTYSGRKLLQTTCFPSVSHSQVEMTEKRHLRKRLGFQRTFLTHTQTDFVSFLVDGSTSSVKAFSLPFFGNYYASY